MKDLLSPATRAYLLRLFVLAAVYSATVHFSFFLIPQGGSGASLVWPPAALALAALFLWGRDLWPAILLPFFFITVLRDIPVPTAFGVALANTIEAFVGAYVLTRLDFHPMLNRLRDVFSLITATALGVTLAASTTTATVFFFGLTPGTINTSLWIALSIGHLVSIMSFGTFFLRWLSEPRGWLTKRELAEGAVLFSSIGALLYLMAWTDVTSVGTISLLYILIIPLIWASLRSGSRGITLALAMTALIITTGILFGSGAVSQTQDVAQSLFGIQVLVGVLSLIFLLFTATTEERRDAVRRLTEHVGALESSLEKVSSEDQAKTDFIAILAHELRNPLSPILSSLEIMKQSGIQAEYQRHLTSIASNVHIMARLLDDLLDISRITQKKFKLQLEAVEFKTIINQTLEIVRPYVDQRKHTLTVVLPEREVWLNADAVRLTQVFVNILNNAAKYTEPSGTISLFVDVQPEHINVHVVDTGVGIPPERLAKIFDSFGGAEGPARRPGGLHIGLSLAKRMVELHHGTIEPKSLGIGHGSEFVVCLPTLATAPLALQHPRQRRRSLFTKEALSELTRNFSQDPLRVLVVDDNEAAAQSLAELLQKNGRRTSTAFNGAEGLERAESERPDVALLDIGLPDMDGHELCRRMRERHGSAIKLIALTGYGQPEDRQKARDAGFDEHVVKPVSIVDLERILAQVGAGQPTRD